MAIEGKVKQEIGYSKKIGIAEFSVIGINLSYPELKEEGFYVKDEDLEKEREFTGEKEGIKQCFVEFALRENKKEGASQRRISFYITENDKENKAGTSFQWINDRGTTSYSDELINLPIWFTGEENSLNARKAKEGLEGFMEFMRSLMKIDWKTGGTLIYDVSKFLKGNFKELKDDLKSDYVGTVLLACTIKVKEDEESGEIKEYESFYNKAFAPGSYAKFLNNKKEFSHEDVSKIKAKIEANKGKKKKDFVSPLENMIAKMTDEGFPCKDVIHLGILKDYITGESYVSTNKVLTDADGPGY